MSAEQNDCLNIWEKIYLYCSGKLLLFVGILIFALVFPICFDIAARQCLGFSVDGMMEIETLCLVVIFCLCVGHLTLSDNHIVVDLFFDRFSDKNRLRLRLASAILCLVPSVLMVWSTWTVGIQWNELTRTLYLPEKYFILITTFAFFTVAFACLILICKYFATMIHAGDFLGIMLVLLVTGFLCALPFLYKAASIKLNGLTIGALTFLGLFTMILLRVPIGLAMCTAAIIGLLILKRNPVSAVRALAELPYRTLTDFVYVAVPMFMLMGELTFRSGMSQALFECANRWLGRLPGGLACASVAGCAGFGAVCGDSLATAITMSSVALPAMRERHYAVTLATGSLAAGGTLGILIPPSMGFIFYSLMTEESIGKLFIAGIVPGILLASIFIAIIMLQCKRNPSLAPRGEEYTLQQKLHSTIGIIPIVVLFMIVVGGILTGLFTPGEGGAVGAFGAWLYAVAKRRMDLHTLKETLISASTITAKVFTIMVGVALMGVLLASSRLPNLLAESVINAGLNKYVFFLMIVLIYILLGCVMNIIPMMLLTLPALYPTVQALGFDGIWFGVATVILMEMGMITPPIGMNVFALSSLAPDIPMAQIFKGVLPFFVGMLLCVFIITLFPSIALWLPSVLF